MRKIVKRRLGFSMSCFFRCLFVLLIGVASGPLQAQQFGQAAQIRTDGLVFSLSDEAQEAINNGVTLAFRCQFAKRSSFGPFSISRSKRGHRFEVLRHALSNRFIVKRDNLDTPHIFRTLGEATNYVADQALILLEFYDDAKNEYSMRLSLNKFELPGPMRLNAFISDAWDIDTGWLAWQSAR